MKLGTAVHHISESDLGTGEVIEVIDADIVVVSWEHSCYMYNAGVNPCRCLVKELKLIEVDLQNYYMELEESVITEEEELEEFDAVFDPIDGTYCKQWLDEIEEQIFEAARIPKAYLNGDICSEIKRGPISRAFINRGDGLEEVNMKTFGEYLKGELNE